MIYRQTDTCNLIMTYNIFDSCRQGRKSEIRPSLANGETKDLMVTDSNDVKL